MECLEQSTLEWLQNIRKQIDYKKPLNTKQMNRIQIEIEVYIFSNWSMEIQSCRMFGNKNR